MKEQGWGGGSWKCLQSISGVSDVQKRSTFMGKRWRGKLDVVLPHSLIVTSNMVEEHVLRERRLSVTAKTYETLYAAQEPH